MANLSCRYLVVLAGSRGGLPRYYWQPSTALRAAGWPARRVPAGWRDYTDPHALRGAAVAEAESLNAALDATRVESGGGAAAPAALGQRSLGDLLAAYRASEAWGGLRPRTQKGYAQCLGKLEAWGGAMPVRAIGARQVQGLAVGMRATPAYAVAVVRVLRLVLEWGRRHGWLTVNAAVRPGLTAPRVGGVIWPAGAVAAFVAAADAAGRHSVGTAVMLNAWLGQREGDILGMPRAVLRDGTLLVRQSKGGAGVALPVGMVASLVDRLEQEQARQQRRLGAGVALPDSLLVNEETGAAWVGDTFRHVFSQVRAAAAAANPDGFAVDYLLPGRDPAAPGAFIVRMSELTFMRLRHTAVTRLAEAECEPGLIASVTGHSQATVVALMARYMVRTTRMARAAFGRRLALEAAAE